MAVPIDVEIIGIGAGAAPEQDILPPGVAAIHGHMIGHYIQDQAHVVLPQGLGKASQRGLSAQLRIDAGGVDDVIAMGGARARLQQWRGVDMADTQAGEIAHQRGGIVQGETGMKLQA